MSTIKNMLVKDTSMWVEFPDIPGFEVKLRFINREELLKIRNTSLVFKFNKRTRQKEEEVDTEKFLNAYASKAIVDWRGLKIKDLPNLVPVDIRGLELNKEIPFSVEEAVDLLANSPVFDQFVTDTLADFEKFSQVKAEEEVKN